MLFLALCCGCLESGSGQHANEKQQRSDPDHTRGSLDPVSKGLVGISVLCEEGQVRQCRSLEQIKQNALARFPNLVSSRESECKLAPPWTRTCLELAVLERFVLGNKTMENQLEIMCEDGFSEACIVY